MEGARYCTCTKQKTGVEGSGQNHIVVGAGEV